jgi:hypothetical protein
MADAGLELDAGAPPDSGLPEAQCPEGHPMGNFYGKPIVEVTINGQGPYEFVYDTGAPTSAADNDLRGQLPTGTSSIGVGGQVVTFGPLPFYDLDQSLRGEIDGVLGSDVMGGFVVTLDVKRERFWLEFDRDEAALLACAHAQGAPSELEYLLDDYYFVPGHAEDLPGWFLLDSGASLGVLTDPIVDQLLAAAPRPYLENFYTPAAIGTFWARLLTVGRLEVGGLSVGRILTRSVPTRLIPAPRFSDGNPFLGVLPTGYLRHFLLTLDQPAGRVRLDPYADDPLEEPTSRYYAGLSLTRSLVAPAVVHSVLAGSGADAAGIEAGDELHRINGVDLSTVDPYAWPWALTSQSEGALLRLNLVHQGVAREVEVRTGNWLTSPDDPR